MSNGKLSKSSRNKVLAGVCGGLGEYFGISPTRIRWAFVAFGLFGAGELAYIILWVLMPKPAV